jgi:putative endonuclease
MKRGGCVYIMASQRNGTLYVGVTARLVERISEHRTHAHANAFSAKYICNILVYYHAFESIEEAILEEKRIKGGSRRKKLQLIEEMNPNWDDLWEEIKDWT